MEPSTLSSLYSALATPNKKATRRGSIRQGTPIQYCHARRPQTTRPQALGLRVLSSPSRGRDARRPRWPRFANRAAYRGRQVVLQAAFTWLGAAHAGCGFHDIILQWKILEPTAARTPGLP